MKYLECYTNWSVITNESQTKEQPVFCSAEDYFYIMKSIIEVELSDYLDDHWGNPEDPEFVLHDRDLLKKHELIIKKWLFQNSFNYDVEVSSDVFSSFKLYSRRSPRLFIYLEAKNGRKADIVLTIGTNKEFTGKANIFSLKIKSFHGQYFGQRLTSDKLTSQYHIHQINLYTNGSSWFKTDSFTIKPQSFTLDSFQVSNIPGFFKLNFLISLGEDFKRNYEAHLNEYIFDGDWADKPHMAEIWSSKLNRYIADKPDATGSQIVDWIEIFSNNNGIFMHIYHNGWYYEDRFLLYPHYFAPNKFPKVAEFIQNFYNKPELYDIYYTCYTDVLEVAIKQDFMVKVLKALLSAFKLNFPELYQRVVNHNYSSSDLSWIRSNCEELFNDIKKKSAATDEWATDLQADAGEYGL